MKRLFSISIVLAVTFFSVTVWSARSSLLDQAAPDFTLKSHSGANIKLSEHRGEVVMINFWASWCGPCRQEMPLLDQLYGKYNPMGFTLFGVNVEEDSQAAKSMLSDLGVDFPILFDTENQVSEDYDVDAMPTTVIVDRNGKVHFVHRGYKPGDELHYQNAIRAALRQ